MIYQLRIFKDIEATKFHRALSDLEFKSCLKDTYDFKKIPIHSIQIAAVSKLNYLF